MTEIQENSEYKNFFRRLFALFLDSFALAPIVWLNQIVSNSSNSAVLIVFCAFISCVTSLFYIVFFTYACGQTPGKMALGVLIINNDGSEKLSLKQAILRNIVAIVVSILVFIFFASSLMGGNIPLGGSVDIGMMIFTQNMGFFIFIFVAILIYQFLQFITVFLNKKRRAIHDYIASTVVIKQLPERRVAGHRKIFWILISLFVINIFVEDRISKPTVENYAQDLTPQQIEEMEYAANKISQQIAEITESIQPDYDGQKCIKIEEGRIYSHYSLTTLVNPIVSCIKSEQYVAAYNLFYVVKFFAIFDAARVEGSENITAEKIILKFKQEILSRKYLSEEQVNKFRDFILEEYSKQNTVNVREVLYQIGYPKYYPHYLMSDETGEVKLIPNFDAQAKWQEILAGN
jgi:uncharacterized RDD family membrane protein YckC